MAVQKTCRIIVLEITNKLKINKMKNFTINVAPMYQDITHKDGSKSYDVSGTLITIKRPDVVTFVEGILSGNFGGWGYMDKVNQALTDGRITKGEFNQIVRILD